jgi:polygalacturonase
MENAPLDLRGKTMAELQAIDRAIRNRLDDPIVSWAETIDLLADLCRVRRAMAETEIHSLNPSHHLQEIRIVTSATEVDGAQVTPERIIPVLRRLIAQIDDELDTARDLTQLTVLLDRRKALRRAVAELDKARKERVQERSDVVNPS